MNVKILADRSGYLNAIEEQKAAWVEFVLGSLGLDMEFVNDSDKGSVFDYFVQENVDIVDYPDIGAVKVSFGGEVVGEWGAADFELKTDGDTKSLYYEITIENWSIFDDENTDEND
jgi:hypothetical protein